MDEERRSEKWMRKGEEKMDEEKRVLLRRCEDR